MPTHLMGPVTILPSTATVPELGGNRPVTSFINVDFPHPDGPTTATNSRSPTSILTRSRASRPSSPSKERLTLLSSTKGRACGTTSLTCPLTTAAIDALIPCTFGRPLGQLTRRHRFFA